MKGSGSTQLPLAFAGLGVAVLLVTSGLKGKTISDVLAGDTGDTFDPKAGADIGSSVTDTSSATGDSTGSGSASAAGQAVGAAGTGKLVTLKTEMSRMANLKSYYKYGGSHAGYNKNGPWDCSSAISQALHTAGFLSGPPRLAAMFMAFGSSGPGEHLTIWAGPTHCFLELDGAFWAWNRTGTIGGWRSTAAAAGAEDNMVKRHPAGY